MNTELASGIHWVGAIDWNVRDFHGYRTERGSTYNAYLIQDERVALIDAVKEAFAGELLGRIRARLGARHPDLVVCNHAEPDHAGGLPAVMKAFPAAELVCDEKCAAALRRYFDTAGWRFRIVATGATLPLGRRTLQFLETPMVHWPESMFTYIPEDQLLFSMDAFGQHYASAHRFDDEQNVQTVMEEARTYYANIVMLYDKSIGRVLDAAMALPIKMVAPSHGVIWRTHIAGILAAYRNWVAHRPAAKVLIIYDTMWKSTEIMAHAILEGALESGVAARLCNVRNTHITELATETLDAATLAVGTPTLNKTLMPEMACALTYLKGLQPVGKAGFAFGSYGWAKGGARDAEDYLKAMRVEILREPLQVQFRPDAAALEECRAAGRLLAGTAIQKAAAAGPAA